LQLWTEWKTNIIIIYFFNIINGTFVLKLVLSTYELQKNLSKNVIISSCIFFRFLNFFKLFYYYYYFILKEFKCYWFKSCFMVSICIHFSLDNTILFDKVEEGYVKCSFLFNRGLCERFLAILFLLEVDSSLSCHYRPL